MIRPERGVEKLLYMLLRLVKIHRQLLLDHFPFLGDVGRRKPGIEKHVREHVEQFIKPVMAGLRVEARILLTGEGIQISTDAFDVLGNPLWTAFAGSLEQKVFDEMRGAILLGGLGATADTDP